MAYIRRIVLLGKSGSGKSSLGNTILGDNHAFSVNHTPNSGTRACHAVTRLIRRRTLTVVDTPGLFDTNAPNCSALSPEIMRCVEECAPGPHAFILVLKIEKFTSQERDIVKLILQHFSDEALRYTIIVFTHGDNLQAGMGIESWAQQSLDLGNILQRCGNRCHVIDNQYWGNSPGSSHDYRNNRNQIDSLLDTIDRMVIASGGSFFTNDLLQNRSLWRRFRDAPTGVQWAILLGVPVVGYLLYTTVPWTLVSQWVVLAAQNGEAWVWQHLPTAEEGIKQAIVYLAGMYNLFSQIQQTQTQAQQSTSYCAVM